MERLRPAIRINEVRFPTSDNNEVTLSQAELFSMFERNGGRATTEIMEQGVGALWQRQIPRMAELKVKEQASAKANLIEHSREYVHTRPLIPWTIRHNIRTIRS